MGDKTLWPTKDNSYDYYLNHKPQSQVLKVTLVTNMTNTLVRTLTKDIIVTYSYYRGDDDDVVVVLIEAV